MALNLSDPGAIVSAYESIIQVANSYNWLLLSYSKFDEIALYNRGTGGLAELKRSIQDLEQVYIAFYREEVDVEPGFLLINYIPASLPAVKRARALVHSRRVGTVLKKHQTTLTVDDLAKLTPDYIHRALAFEDLDEPDTPTSTSTMGRTSSQPLNPRNNKTLPPIQPLRRPQPDSAYALPPHNNTITNKSTHSQPFAFEPVRRAFSETQNAPTSTSFPIEAPLIAKSSSMFTAFMRRKKKHSDSFDSAESGGLGQGGGGPPTPPKDKGKFTVQQPVQYYQSSYALSPSAPHPHFQRSRTGSFSEFAVISHDHAHDDEEYVDLGRGRGRTQPAPVQTLSMSLPLKGKWAPEVVDMAERLRRRHEALKRQAEEEAAAIEEEKARKAEMRARKAALAREDAEEEARKRREREEEMRRVAIEKRRLERLEKEEEERKRLEIEERRRIDRERRMEEHRRLEAWRREQERTKKEAERKAEEARRREEVERTKKIQLAEAKVKKNHSVDGLVSGWVTMQTSDSLFWKRRFYKFIGSTVYFYRSPKDTQTFLDKAELRGRVRGLREWNEGYEDLEAIAHSFAVEFKDDRRSWSMFADTEEEKYKLLGLLHHAAGL
ncbi:hypothetical protein Hypma_011949 [Hypsizygus marmoreus]|uniref:ADF-H domain-containing protein n=1 Tax=Hypsizygus marmoreus TaxID=39966 RepID=A0A369JFJ4_HYPMA|nr:hypothetical protein Hypma_011949 [Hypsizygus marmoreus]